MIRPATNPQAWDGGLRATVPFRAVWCIDFEFNGPPGERPRPVCMVVREIFTGEEVRLWRDELLALGRPPFDVGPDSLVVAYAAQAEIGCFFTLGWPLPCNILDLFAEHRCSTNGLILPCGNGLLGALACHGLGHIDAGEKEMMRRLIMDNDDWSNPQKHELFEYCASDVDGLDALLHVMAPTIDWPRALLRGRHAGAVAKQQHAGVPIDVNLHRRLLPNWEPLKQRLVREIDGDFGIYDGTTFKAARFAEWLEAHGIPWPRLPSGQLALADDVFKQMALRFPLIRPIHDLRTTMGKLRLTGLAVGADGRNRFSIWPFSAKTGRNQPSTTESIFGPSKWMRGLIRPTEDHGIAYIDFVAQEIGIAAALSGDQRLIDAYRSDDPYICFAKMASLVPADATAIGYRAIRERCKQVMIAVSYGMGPRSLADRLGVTLIDAHELLRLHRLTFPRFWRWSGDAVASAMLTNRMSSVFGWQLHVGPDPNPRSLMNFPMQANGAEMMRIAAIAATETGIEVCAPVHDAFLISAPIHRLDDDIAHMREIMTKAGNVVTGGLDIRTSAQVFRWPNRFMSESGLEMWQRVTRLLSVMEAAQ